MTRFKHIGQVFTKPITLDLLPFEQITTSYYQVTVSYTTDQNWSTVYHTSEFHSASNLNIILGNDVKSISVFVSDLNINGWYRSYSIRADHLILLNLAKKLLRPI